MLDMIKKIRDAWCLMPSKSACLPQEKQFQMLPGFC